jgi:hypothetical protein
MRAILFRSAAAAATATVLAATTPGPPAFAAAPDTSPPRLHAITVSSRSITVAGLDVVNLTVSVRLTDDVGVVDYSDITGLNVPYLYYEPADTFVRLHLAGGTAQDGVWSGVVAVTSAWHGAVRPSRLYVTDAALNTLNVDPRTLAGTPVVAVTGSHHPALTLTISPNPVSAPAVPTLHVQAHDADTGRTWPYLPLVIGGAGRGTTDASGRFQVRLPDLPDLVTANVDGPANPGQPTTVIAEASTIVGYRYAVTAAPALATVPARTNVDVHGQLWPRTSDRPVQLQRRYRRGWRTVNTAPAGPGTAFTVIATPPLGTWSYRIYVPGDSNIVDNFSPTFTLRDGNIVGNVSPTFTLRGR